MVEIAADPDDQVEYVGGPPPDKSHRQRLFDSLSIITDGNRYRYGQSCNDGSDEPRGTFLYSWGAGFSGRKSARGPCKASLTPYHIEIPESVRYVSCAGSQSACCTDSGHVYIWGDPGRYNQLGSMTEGNISQSIPILVQSLVHANVFIRQIACGYGHTVALTDDGRLWTWGISKNGQTGQGDRITVRSPKKIDIEVKFTWISCGDRHTAGLSASGHVYTCGHGEHGQLGHGTNNDELRLKLVSDLANLKIKRVQCGSIMTAAIDQSGSLYLWGFGEAIFPPNINFQYKPMLFRLKDKLKDVSCGHSHIMGLNETGDVWVWGSNEFQQLGNGDTRSTRIPQMVLDGKDIASIYAGRHHCAAINKLGLIYTWGCGEDGQLGHNNLSNVIVPRLVQALLGHIVGQISCADRHMLAITSVPYRHVSDDILHIYHTETLERKLKIRALQALRDGATLPVAERAQISKFLHQHNVPGANHLRLQALSRLLPDHLFTNEIQSGSRTERIYSTDTVLDSGRHSSLTAREPIERIEHKVLENALIQRPAGALVPLQPSDEGAVARICFHREMSIPLKTTLQAFKMTGLGSSEAKAEYKRISESIFLIRKELDRCRYQNGELMRQYQILENEKTLVSETARINQQNEQMLVQKLDSIRIQLDTVIIKINETFNTRKRYEQSVAQLRDEINDLQRRFTAARQLDKWHVIGLAKIQQAQLKISSDTTLADVKVFGSEAAKFNRFLRDHLNKFKSICELMLQERKLRASDHERKGEDHRKQQQNQRICNLLASVHSREKRMLALQDHITSLTNQKASLQAQFDKIVAITGCRGSKEIITRFYMRKEIEADLRAQQAAALITIDKLKLEHAIELEKAERVENIAQIPIQAVERLLEQCRAAQSRRYEIVDQYNVLVARRAQMHEFFTVLLRRLNSALGQAPRQYSSLFKLLSGLHDTLHQCRISHRYDSSDSGQ